MEKLLLQYRYSHRLISSSTAVHYVLHGKKTPDRFAAKQLSCIIGLLICKHLNWVITLLYKGKATAMLKLIIMASVLCDVVILICLIFIFTLCFQWIWSQLSQTCVSKCFFSLEKRVLGEMYMVKYLYSIKYKINVVVVNNNNNNRLDHDYYNYYKMFVM